MMNKYIDNQEEPETDELERTRYGQKVFDMVKGIDVEFGKKKKEEDGTTTRKKRKQDKMEEPPVAPFLSRSSCVSSSTCHTRRS
jgi:hypothetical protein